MNADSSNEALHADSINEALHADSINDPALWIESKTTTGIIPLIPWNQLSAGKELGKGNFGTVVKGIHTTGSSSRDVALKYVGLNCGENEKMMDLKEEVCIAPLLKMFSHICNSLLY